MTAWYRASLACGLLPLLLGTVTFVTWVWTNLFALIFVGLVVVYGGLALFAAGLVCLYVYTRKARRAAVWYRRGLAVAGGVLLLNFPVCAAYLFITFDVLSVTLVTVENRYEQPIRDLVLQDYAGNVHRIGSVLPGDMTKACLRLDGEGAVTYTLTRDGAELSGDLIGYLTWGGSHARLTLLRYGAVDAQPGLDRISGADFVRHCIW